VILRALLLDDSVLRLNVNQFTLRPLAEKHPRFIVEMVNRLGGTGTEARAEGEQEEGEDEVGEEEEEEDEEFAKHERREEAWLSLVTLGNAISMCGDIVEGGGNGAGDKIALPLEVVLGCLSHPSSTVKLGAFSLVTDKPAINSPLSEGEVVVVKRFLEAGINTGESE